MESTSSTTANTTLEWTFKEITADKVQSWEKILSDSKFEFRTLINDDAEIFNIEHSLPNQRVIHNDCERTRSNERSAVPSFVEYSESIWTYYCRENKIKYKQGLNEIIGPFVLLKYKINISFSRIYNMFTFFIDKYLTNYFIEEEFHSFQSSLNLLSMLLKYHDPEWFNIFECSMISPEMYAASWILTVFANKCSLNVVYHLWDKLILFNDNWLMHFISIAFLIVSRNKFLDVDYSQIPSIICQLKILSVAEVDDILGWALDLFNKTPLSFRKIVDNWDIFSYRSTQLKDWYESYQHSWTQAFPIYPAEWLRWINSDKINCVDTKCSNFYPIIQKITNPGCNFCINTSTNLITSKYIIVDLRIKNVEDQRSIHQILNNNDNTNCPGYFKPSVSPDLTKIKDWNDEINTPVFAEDILKELERYYNIFHIIFLTSFTAYYTEDKDNMKRYKTNITSTEIINERTKRKGKTFHRSKNKIKNQKLYAQEYSIFMYWIRMLMKKNVKYISYAYGGYKYIHNWALTYQIEILMHGSNCDICKINKKNKEIAYLDSKEHNKKTKNKNGVDVISDISKEEAFGKKGYECHMKIQNQIVSVSMLIVFEGSGMLVYRLKKNTKDTYYHTGTIWFNQITNVFHETKLGKAVCVYYKIQGNIEQLLWIDFDEEKEITRFIAETEWKCKGERK